jgi:glycosyltransferase involved in cell wall biosynthesis
MKMPLISVIIPARNSANTIGIAVESILNQTYPNLEIIIVDDNSTDNTYEVVNQYIIKNDNIFYYALTKDDPHRLNKQGRNINAGWTARNYGFEKVRGEWITFQDADDASLINRIEVQYNLAEKYKSSHVCVDWQQYKQEYLGKILDTDAIMAKHSNIIVSRENITTLARKTKGIFHKLFGSLHSYIPFKYKQMRVLNRLFFGALDAYPGAGNSPLFKKEIIKHVRFRPYNKRVWPSFVGRGADRDFNFQVAETFKNSMVFKLPLYLWRQNKQNIGYENYEKYIYKI